MDKYRSLINGGRAEVRVKGAGGSEAGEGLQRPDIDGGGKARLVCLLLEKERWFGLIASLAVLPPEISP